MHKETPRDSPALCFLRNQAPAGCLLKQKKNLRLKSKALLIPRGPRRTGPSPILVFEPSTSHVFTALAHSPRQASVSPSPLRLVWGFSLLLLGHTEPWGVAVIWSSLPFSCCTSKPRVPQAPRERAPASSQEAPLHPRCCRRARRVGSSTPCLRRRLGHAQRPRETVSKRGPEPGHQMGCVEDSLFCRVTV